MKKIIVITDSTCDLTKEIIEKRNIKIIPLKVCFNEKMYKDLFELTPTEMYKEVEKLNILPKTAAITIEEFKQEFDKYLTDEDNEIIFCGISSKLSSTIQNAMVARNSYNDDTAKRIHIIDSHNLSTGIGLTVLKICDMRDSGVDIIDIVKEANRIVKCVRAQFSVRDLTYLHKGGRCSGTSKFFGTMLRIRPILRVYDGSIILSEKVFGKYEKSLDLQIQDITKNIHHVDDENLFITHSMGDEEAKYILDNLPEVVKKTFKNIYVTNAGCVISSHCGPHTIGILYIKKTPLTSDK